MGASQADTRRGRRGGGWNHSIPGFSVRLVHPLQLCCESHRWAMLLRPLSKKLALCRFGRREKSVFHSLFLEIAWGHEEFCSKRYQRCVVIHKQPSALCLLLLWVVGNRFLNPPAWKWAAVLMAGFLPSGKSSCTAADESNQLLPQWHYSAARKYCNSLMKFNFKWANGWSADLTSGFVSWKPGGPWFEHVTLSCEDAVPCHA